MYFEQFFALLISMNALENSYVFLVYGYSPAMNMPLMLPPGMHQDMMNGVPSFHMVATAEIPIPSPMPPSRAATASTNTASSRHDSSGSQPGDFQDLMDDLE